MRLRAVMRPFVASRFRHVEPVVTRRAIAWSASRALIDFDRRLDSDNARGVWACRTRGAVLSLPSTLAGSAWRHGRRDRAASGAWLGDGSQHGVALSRMPGSAVWTVPDRGQVNHWPEP
ncbi:MAG: hypothetical protein K0S65_6324 [Labilithrix sp.]|nr:hypothetical protein [Labilithrix sp.]